MPTSVDIYVDGSWMAGTTGYGLMVLSNDQPLYEAFGPVADADTEGSRQVAGELFAVGHALRWCKGQGVTTVKVYFDYYGIEKWATGEWKAKKNITQRYQQFVRTCGLRIQWVKVAAHTGNRWNEYVDQLAKLGAQGQRGSKP
jgi:ribonuclease H-related protein